MVLAVTVQELKDVLFGAPDVPQPASVPDSMLTGIIERQTAVVLSLRGLDALPSGLELDVVRSATLSLSLIQARRFMRGDDANFLRILNAEEVALKEDIRVVRESGQGNRFFEVV